MHEFKKDVRDHLKEVRETTKVYAETITVLRENMVKLSTIAENQDKKLDAINDEISQLKTNKKDSLTNEDRSWYQKFIENKEKFFMYVLIVLLAFSLGLRIEDVSKVFGGM